MKFTGSIIACVALAACANAAAVPTPAPRAVERRQGNGVNLGSGTGDVFNNNGGDVGNGMTGGGDGSTCTGGNIGGVCFGDLTTQTDDDSGSYSTEEYQSISEGDGTTITFQGSAPPSSSSSPSPSSSGSSSRPAATSSSSSGNNGNGAMQARAFSGSATGPLVAVGAVAIGALFL